MPSRSPDVEAKGAAEYGREAIAHWTEAARLGARALAERKRERGGGGGGLSSELGELADTTLAKFGKTGKLASKVGVGRRAVKHLLPEIEAGEEEEGAEPTDAAAEGAEDHLFDDGATMPIQESIDVAVPVAAVFDLCTRFEELPRFSDRIDAVEVEGEGHLAVAAKVGRSQQVLAIEITGEEPEERIDWECEEGVEHAGVVSFHPLAPRLTRLELTIEPRSEGVPERLLRLAGLPERAVRRELHRFKAYAELWDEANDYKSADFKDPGSEPEDDEEEPEDEEPEDLEPEDDDEKGT
jgi:uncharacterized membrane protein